MALFPVQGIFEGDFVVMLIPVDDADPMSIVAEKVAHHAAGRRVAAQAGALQVRYRGQVLPDTSTVIDAGVAPLDVLQVGYR